MLAGLHPQRQPCSPGREACSLCGFSNELASGLLCSGSALSEQLRLHWGTGTFSPQRAVQRAGEALHIHTSTRSAWSHRDICSSSFEAKLFAELPTEGKFSSWLLSTKTGQVVPEKQFVCGRRMFPTLIAAVEAEELQMPPLQAGLSPAAVLLPPPVPLSGCAESQCWPWAGKSHGVRTAAPSPA